ncbi:MAG: hypothetical protein QOJ29_1106 [Thermoleophilaceae bacterium]|jgi:hypothetical protein|nr:hypothetical protein [Thermoleophilaceae bacterium]
MRGTFALFVATLVLIATGLALYSALGILRNSDDPAAGAVVAAFGAALKQHDGARACALLAPVAQSRIEEDRKKPCEQGVLELASDLGPRGAVRHVNVAENSAFVTTTGGGAFFLGRFGPKWKLSAAGCQRQAGDAPYDCALQG